MDYQSKTPRVEYKLNTKILELEETLSFSNDELVSIAQQFHKTLKNAKEGSLSSLRYLNSYSLKPTGKEKGLFLTLDMGGSNLRCSLIELLGQGNYQEKKQMTVPLIDLQYNYLSKNATGNELFRFHVNLLSEVIKTVHYDKYLLGYTFSFPCKQTSIKNAQLISWAKEIRTSGVIGKDIGFLLETALEEMNLNKTILLKAIINDTVGTLLTAAYQDTNCDIGSILGTGHNTCYIEPQNNNIINLESGNFDGMRLSQYDKIMDHSSNNPGQQRLEKMVSGKYLGELFRLIIQDLANNGYIFKGLVPEVLDTPYSLTSQDLSIVISGNDTDMNSIWTNKISKIPPTPEELWVLQKIATLILKRSARLVAGTYLGILHHLDPQLNNKHLIAIDGSLFEKMPGYAGTLQSALSSIIEKPHLVEVKLAKHGSRIGAAIAAANSHL